MELKQLRQKSADELKGHLLYLQKEQFSLRMQKATQQLTNHSTLGKTRRDIARTKTILAQKKKEAAK